MRRAAHRAEPELAAVRSELTRRLNELFSLQELTYVLSDSIQVERIAEQVAGHLTSRHGHFDGTDQAHAALPGSQRARKFFSNPLPWGVAMDSG